MSSASSREVLRVGGARGGLASQGVAPPVLSGAALGHDRVRDGTGWGHHALGHGHPAPSVRRQDDPLRHTPRAGPLPRLAPVGSPTRPARSGHTLPAPTVVRSAPGHTRVGSAPGRCRRPDGRPRHPPAGAGRPGPSAAPQRRPQHEYRRSVEGGPPSTIRTARLQSVARGPPAAYQPGHLPGVLPLASGDARLGEGFPLRCFQRFARPHVATQRCRSRDNWHTSGASTPVLSY